MVGIVALNHAILVRIQARQPMKNQDIKFMEIALSEAGLALREDELPVGAVVVFNGEIWGRGRRMKEKNTRLDHGEVNALREALDKNHKLADEMTIYTTLEPCVMCFGAILNSRIKRVVFALEDPYGGATHFQAVNMPERHKIKFPEITKGILRQEAKLLFQEFFKTTKSDYWSSHPENPLVRICFDS